METLSRTIDHFQSRLILNGEIDQKGAMFQFTEILQRPQNTLTHHSYVERCIIRTLNAINL